MAFGPDNRLMMAGRASTATVDQAALDVGLRRYMLGVYNYVASGVLLTGIVALVIASTPALSELFFTRVMTPRGAATVPTILGYVAIFSPLVIMFLGGAMARSTATAQAIYWGFSALMGISMANIFLIYTGESAARVFFITAATFGAMSLWGYTTQRDLTKMGSFLIMGLFGIILASLVNMLIGSSALQFAISVIGVVIFVGLIAYDTQRIKSDYFAYSYAEGQELANKRAVFDALGLYLNFVNLFQLLMSLLGNRQSE